MATRRDAAPLVVGGADGAVVVDRGPLGDAGPQREQRAGVAGGDILNVKRNRRSGRSARAGRRTGVAVIVTPFQKVGGTGWRGWSWVLAHGLAAVEGERVSALPAAWTRLAAQVGEGPGDPDHLEGGAVADLPEAGSPLDGARAPAAGR